MHWGTEYDHLATSTQLEQAKALLASPDVDVILGDHAHVVQPMQQINGKWVIYCMGNQISRHSDPIDDSREGVMPEFTFTETSPHHFRVTRAEAIPTWMQMTPALRLLDLADAQERSEHVARGPGHVRPHLRAGHRLSRRLRRGARRPGGQVLTQAGSSSASGFSTAARFTVSSAARFTRSSAARWPMSSIAPTPIPASTIGTHTHSR